MFRPTSVSKSALLAPFWVAQVFTGAKSFKNNPVIGSSWLNRHGLHVWRVRLAQALADRRRRRIAHLLEPEDRAVFARDGVLAVADFLEPAHFAAVRDEVMSAALPGRQFREGDAVTRRVPLTPAVLKTLPACARLLDLPGFQGRLRYVSSFDVEPALYLQTILSHVDGRASGAPATDPQTALHMDTFHPTMKAWLFLEDVALEDGPFTYVAGSTARTARRLAWERRRSVELSRPGHKAGGAFRIRQDELRRLRLPAPTAFAVQANTLVVGDTSGFHARGASDRPSVRIEIFASTRRNPFLPFAGLDVWSLPGLRRRQIALYWWALALIERLGGPRSQWRDSGRLRTSDPATRIR